MARPAATSSIRAASAATGFAWRLNGSGINGSPTSPDSVTRFVSVEATKTQGAADGTLRTGGASEPGVGPFYEFTGRVTCMQIADDGRRVVVGAYGTESFEGSELAGKYAQLLTVEFGTFESPELEGRTTLYSDTFGASERGVESSRPPRCNRASFAMQYLPGRGGVMQLTRSRR